MSMDERRREEERVSKAKDPTRSTKRDVTKQTRGIDRDRQTFISFGRDRKRSYPFVLLISP